MNKKGYKYTFTMCNDKEIIIKRDSGFNIENLINGDWVVFDDERSLKSVYLKKDNIVSIVEEEIYL